jgi:hypothetical protein
VPFLCRLRMSSYGCANSILRLFLLFCPFFTILLLQVFARIRCECDRLDLLTDELFLHDIQTVVDDPRYFIFEVRCCCLSLLYLKAFLSLVCLPLI